MSEPGTYTVGPLIIEKRPILSDPTKFRRQVTQVEFERAKTVLRGLRKQRHTIEKGGLIAALVTGITGYAEFVDYRIKRNRAVIGAYIYQQKLITFPGRKEFQGHARFMGRSDEIIVFPGKRKPPDGPRITRWLNPQLTMM